MVLWQPGPELMGKLCGSEEVPHFLFSLSPLCCNIEGAGKGDRTVDLLRTCLGLGGLSQPIPDWSHFIPHLHVHTPSQSRSPGSLKQGHTTSSPVLYQVGIQLSQLTAPRTPLSPGQTHQNPTSGRTPPLQLALSRLFTGRKFVLALRAHCLTLSCSFPSQVYSFMASKK